MWAIKLHDNQSPVWEYASDHHEGLNLLNVLKYLRMKCGTNNYSVINFVIEFHIKLQKMFDISYGSEY